MTNNKQMTFGDSVRLPVDSEVSREPDLDLLCETPYGPYMRPKDPEEAKFKAIIHETLWEVFRRMDAKESEKFQRFIGMLSSLSSDEIENIYKLVKGFEFCRWLFRGVKWLILTFLAGVAATAAFGEHTEKIIGYIKSIATFWKGTR